MLTFQRPIKAHDELDKSIVTNTSQAVIFAVGPINQRQEASYHTSRNKGTDLRYENLLGDEHGEENVLCVLYE